MSRGMLYPCVLQQPRDSGPAGLPSSGPALRNGLRRAQQDKKVWPKSLLKSC